MKEVVFLDGVRSGGDSNRIGHAVFGHVINTELKDMYLARVAAVNVAKENNITLADRDAFAVERQ